MRLLILDHCECCDGSSVRLLRLSIYIRPRFLSRAEGNRGAGGLYLPLTSPPPILGRHINPTHRKMIVHFLLLVKNEVLKLDP